MLEKISIDTARVIQEALSKGLSPKALLASPDQIEQKITSPLTGQVREELSALSTSSLAKQVVAYDQETIETLNAILLDGRFVSTWKENPSETLKNLGIEPRVGLVRKIEDVDIGPLINHRPDDVAYIGLVSIVVAVVVGAVIARGDEQIGYPPPVLDLSGVQKF